IEEAVIEEVVIALPEPAVEPVAVEVVVVEEAVSVSVETVKAPAASTPPMAINESRPAIDSSLPEDVAVSADVAPNEPRTASLFDSVPSPTPFAKPAETAVDAMDKPEPVQVAEEDTEENQAPDDKHNV
ncbi:MAG TPA: hypothetical protein VLZ76_12045, partial [Lysobacter sp.]|nr:hypothetical protein [Lysobacter sp.]